MTAAAARAASEFSWCNLGTWGWADYLGVFLIVLTVALLVETVVERIVKTRERR